MQQPNANKAMAEKASPSIGTMSQPSKEDIERRGQSQSCGRTPQRPRPEKPVQPRDGDLYSPWNQRQSGSSGNGPNPRDPPNGRTFAMGPQPRDDGTGRSNRGQHRHPKPEPRPRPWPRDPPQK